MITGAEVRTGKPAPKPRMRPKGVSVAIVVGGRESHVQGEAAIRSFAMTVAVRDEGSRPQGL
jgi:hypothetical protein